MVTDRKRKRKAKQRTNGRHAEPTVEVTTTGSIMLDLALGGGVAWNKNVNVIGDSSSGKTLVTTEIIAACRDKYGDDFDWMYDDAENGYSFDSEYMYGFDMRPNIDPETGQPYRSVTVEDLIHNIQTYTTKAKEAGKKYFIYVVDSFDSLSSNAEMARNDKAMKAADKGEEIKEGTYNLEKQKKINEFFRVGIDKVEIENFMLIVVSQVRENIGVMYGDKYNWHAKKALKFYSSQQIFLTEVERYKSLNRVTGISIKAFILKNKIGKPFLECYLDILFDWGLDDVASCVDFIYDLKTDKGGKVKKSISVTFENEKFKNRSKFIEWIYDNKKVRLIKKMAKRKWKEIDEKTSTKRQRKYQDG
jgi:recombination protein RecA